MRKSMLFAAFACLSSAVQCSNGESRGDSDHLGAGSGGRGLAGSGSGAAGAAAGGFSGDAGAGTGASSGGNPAGRDSGFTDDARADSGGIDGAEAGPGATLTGTLVPLYAYPTHASWNALVAAKTAHPAVPVVAIVNSSNGPGPSVDRVFTSGIDKLVGAGITVIGYVPTSYASRPETTVNAEVDQWQSFYPKLKGIFFDEQANTRGDEAYYQRISQYAKSKGLNFTVGNPGSSMPESYIDTVDTTLIYESAGVPPLSRLMGWYQSYDRGHFGIIPYGTQLNEEFVRNAKAYVGYIYLTDDVLPNPWDTIPPYFDQLLALLER